MCASPVQSEARHCSPCIARELHDANAIAGKHVLGKALNRGIHPTAILEGEPGTASLDLLSETSSADNVTDLPAGVGGGVVAVAGLAAAGARASAM